MNWNKSSRLQKPAAVQRAVVARSGAHGGGRQAGGAEGVKGGAAAFDTLLLPYRGQWTFLRDDTFDAISG
jgi:hypothetical protein